MKNILPTSIDNMPLSVAVALISCTGDILHVNQTLAQKWMTSDVNSIVGQPVEKLWSNPQKWQSVFLKVQGKGTWQGELIGLLADGTHLSFNVKIDKAKLPDHMAGYVIACRPNSGKEAQSTEALEKILYLTDVAVLSADKNGIIFQANKSASDLFGYSNSEFIGISVHTLVPPDLRDSHIEHLQRFVAGPQDELSMNKRGGIAGCRKDGSTFPAIATISKFFFNNEWILVATIKDITNQKKSQEKLVWQTIHDPLTQIPNRPHMKEKINYALAQSKNHGNGVAVLFIDLDGFKLVNDAHGHDIGDQILVEVTRLFQKQLKPSESLGRVGSDEFVVLCENVDDTALLTSLAENINAALRHSIIVEKHIIFITCSIGIAFGHGTTDDAESLLRDADVAMSKAKEQGRDGWEYFQSNLYDETRERLSIAMGLRDAVSNNELEVVFQPIVGAQRHIISGAEILLRWTPDSGPVSPAFFIPIAETTGSIVAIGSWVFSQACLAEASWRKEFGKNAPYISVNVSTRQLSEPGIVENFQSIIKNYGAEPANMVIEVTETSLMTDVKANIKVLNRFAEAGFKVAVDDFGTGYSSLAQLERLPLDILKVDRAFVDGLDKRQESQAIVNAIITMAQSLHFKIIAEGVETKAQLQFLQELDTDYIQGYYFYKPMYEKDFHAALSASQDLQDKSNHDLHFILYLSRAAKPFSPDELRALNSQAKRFNVTAGISGFLLYLDGTFMQIIEGERQVIQSLMGRIEADKRHTHIQQVLSGSIKRRLFPLWSMGFMEIDTIPDIDPDIAKRADGKAWFENMCAKPEAAFNLIRIVSLAMK